MTTMHLVKIKCTQIKHNWSGCLSLHRLLKPDHCLVTILRNPNYCQSMALQMYYDYQTELAQQNLSNLLIRPLTSLVKFLRASMMPLLFDFCRPDSEIDWQLSQYWQCVRQPMSRNPFLMFLNQTHPSYFPGCQHSWLQIKIQFK